jgi:hypothetical protein
MSNSRPSRRDLMDAIIDRASRDPSLRAALLQEPKPAIYRQFGVEIPLDFNIRFIERDHELDALIVLPPLEQGLPEEVEWDDEALEGVVGGAHGHGPAKFEFAWSEML